MLRSILLQFGSAASGEPLRFEPGPMTIFVGPNNSGKSLTLQEIEDFIESGGRAPHIILDRIELDLPSWKEVERLLLERRLDDAPSRSVREGWIRVSRLKPVGEHVKKRQTDTAEPPGERLVSLDSVSRALAGDTLQPGDAGVLFRDVVSLFTLRLDGRTRLALTLPRPAGDLQEHPSNFLMALFKNDEARRRIRELTADAFGMHFVIDPTGVTHLRIRMASRPPSGAAEEQSLGVEARSYHAGATPIDELSDGIKAFTGLAAAVLSAEYRVMLIDEPEAFLHPPLTRKLGRRLTEIASERGANVIAATHSPEFLMGCIQSGERVNIVRMTYREGVPGATFLPARKLQGLMRDPLLRSTGVLNALFHEGAVICEADADRVFYQEINERLVAAGSGGVDGALFLNAQNKQTIRKILRPLREMGIPAAAVVDLDIFKSRDDLDDLMRAGYVPTILRTAWEGMRRRLDRAIKPAMYKDGGLETLGREPRDEARRLLENLASYGIFVVPVGELECWLGELEVGGHGPDWLTRVFEKMGLDPEEASYLHPTGGGVWSFVGLVADWIADPHRKGLRQEEEIPADHRLPPAEVA
jgi:NAD(P)-dependent dehydrogenase (short-subunit alcohol dehydrogenase family)